MTQDLFRDLPAEHSAYRSAALQNVLIGLPTDTSRTTRLFSRWHAVSRGRRIAVGSVVAGGPVAAGGGVAFAALSASAPVADHTQARCYSKVSSNFGDDFPGTTAGVAQGSDGSGGTVLDPVSLCASVLYPDAATVPVLTACVLPDGIAAVFPAPATICQQLGLSAALPR